MNLKSTAPSPAVAETEQLKDVDASSLACAIVSELTTDLRSLIKTLVEEVRSLALHIVFTRKARRLYGIVLTA